MNPSALDRHAVLVAGLQQARAYPHAVDAVQTIETHISTVLLAGEYAYKLKKPVDLGFLDFTDLAQRRFFCEEELRLNRRTAPQLYLDVVPVTGTPDAPRIAGAGEAIDYALRMRRFADDALLDRRARDGRLTADDIDRLAQSIAAFHLNAAPAPENQFGIDVEILRRARDNFAQLRAQGLDAKTSAALARLEAWSEREFERCKPRFALRRAQGLVRECHGDMHLGNLVLLDGVPTPFDALEFEPRLRNIDVISDFAFAFMDLFDHGLPRFAWRLLDRYLQATGDYAGLDVLRFYSVYRALVRAKVAKIRSAQARAGAARLAAESDCAHHVRLAESLSQIGAPLLALTFGVSGAGKTTVAGALLERLGAVRVRSDVERKRMFELAPTARVDAAARERLYSAQATHQTYARLAALAEMIIQAGYPALIDAAFLRRSEREELRTLAARLRVRFALIECTAGAEVLRERVAQRRAADADASDATAAVLERQLATHEPVAEDERAFTFTVATDVDHAALEARCDEIAALLR